MEFDSRKYSNEHLVIVRSITRASERGEGSDTCCMLSCIICSSAYEYKVKCNKIGLKINFVTSSTRTWHLLFNNASVFPENPPSKGHGNRNFCPNYYCPIFGTIPNCVIILKYPGT